MSLGGSVDRFACDSCFLDTLHLLMLMLDDLWSQDRRMIGCILVGHGFGLRLCTYAMYDYYYHHLVPRDLMYMYMYLH